MQEVVLKDLFVPMRRELRDRRPLGGLLKPQEQQQTDLILPHLTRDLLEHLINQVQELQEQEMETVLATTVMRRQRQEALPMQETCQEERQEPQETVVPMNQPKSEAREAVALEVEVVEPSKALQVERAVQVKFITDL